MTHRQGTLLILAVCLAALAESIAGTVLAFARTDIIGDTYATSDEFARLDVAYTALKLIGFVAAPSLLARVGSRQQLVVSVLALGGACLLSCVTTRLDALVVLRAVQGFAGGVLLVTGQAMLLLAFPSRQQAFIQALYAIGAVVAPATLTPALHGWLLDLESWPWIFGSVVPLAVGSAGCLLLADFRSGPQDAHGSFDAPGFLLLGGALACATYVLGQAPRWDWLQAPHVRWLSLLGAACLIAYLGSQFVRPSPRVLEPEAFRSSDFTFAFIVSFVAGAALLGSTFLISSSGLTLLRFAAADVGELLLPGAAIFIATLLIVAYLVQVRRVPPMLTVPIGVLSVVISMWLLSGSTAESGTSDLLAPLLLRSLGLGILFLSITLVAFGKVPPKHIPTAVGIFNVGRQLGGLIGVAGLQTLMDHEFIGNIVALGANLTSGSPAIDERLSGTGAALAGSGADPAAAGRTSLALLSQALRTQSSAIAFDTAFAAVALGLLTAAPLIVAIKLGLGRQGSPRS